jgi:hypothetical protein
LIVRTTDFEAHRPGKCPDVVTGLLTGMEMRDVRIEMEQTAGEFGVMQTTLEQYIAHAYRGDWPNE